MIGYLQNRFQDLPLRRIYEAGCHSRSQLYEWHKGISLDRKARLPKVLDGAVIENAARVVAYFPHFGGVKGQAFSAVSRDGSHRSESL